MKTLKHVLDRRLEQAEDYLNRRSEYHKNPNPYSNFIKASYVMNKTSIEVCFDSIVMTVVECADVASGNIHETEKDMVFNYAFSKCILLLGMQQMNQDHKAVLKFIKEHIIGESLTIDLDNVEKAGINIDKVLLYAKAVGETLTNTKEATTIEVTTGQLILALLHLELRMEGKHDHVKIDSKVQEG